MTELKEKMRGFFEQLCAIPHMSRHEQAIGEYLMEFAKQRGLSCHQDAAGNVFMEKPATKGYENAPTVMLQGHMDMVCVKTPETEKDFLTQGIDVYEENGVLQARGTSLGADDGVAIAYALAILDSEELIHPPLQGVFTVGEEISMVGAQQLRREDLKGSILLNMDTEQEGTFFVSSAGSADQTITLPIDWEGCSAPAYELRVYGMKGGHSGMEIHKIRMNAIKVLGRMLAAVAPLVQLGTMEGGNALNVICSSASATIAVEEEKKAKVQQLLEQEAQKINGEYEGTDHMEWSLTLAEGAKVMTKESQEKAIALLDLLPSGVEKMSSAIAGLVETSQNLGMLRCEKELQLGLMARSAGQSGKEYVLGRNAHLAGILGATATVGGDSPSWSYDPHSKVRPLAVSLYQEMFGKGAACDAIHAGLECGYFARLLEDVQVDILSYGPTILDIHSTKERMEVASMERMFAFTVKLLEKIATEMR